LGSYAYFVFDLLGKFFLHLNQTFFCRNMKKKREREKKANFDHWSFLVLRKKFFGHFSFGKFFEKKNQ